MSIGTNEDDLQIGKNESRLDKKSPRKRSVHKVHEHFEAIFYSRLAALANFQPQAEKLRRFYIADVGYYPNAIYQSTRLGIRKGRDEHLPYRFIDADFVNYATKRPKDETKRIIT